MTIHKLIVDAGEVCEKFHDKHVHSVKIRERIELDELWNFVYAKEKNVPYAINPPAFAGDCWTHIAIDSRTKMVISYRIGKRKPIETYWLFKDLKKRIDTDGLPEFASDGYPPYERYALKVFGEDVSLVNIIGREKIKVSGNPDMENTGTTFVERYNLTKRMSIRRYTRKTNAFSKDVKLQRAHDHLHVTWYNWCRIHETLRVSPAMEAGLCDVLYDMGFIVDLIEESKQPPNRPKIYKKRESVGLGFFLSVVL